MSIISSFGVVPHQQINTAFPVPWSNDQNINTDFIINATCIPAASGAFSGGNPITWNFLTPVSGHSFTFFTGIDSTGIDLSILYPTVRTVLKGTVSTDDKGALNTIFAGTGVNFSNLTINANYGVPLNTMMVADGAGNWTNDDPILNAFFTFTAFGGPGAGETGINIINTYISPFTLTGTSVNYQGGGNFLINRRYVGIPNQIVFKLINAATGVPLAANPAAGERVSISAAATVSSSIRHDLWVAANSFMAGGGFNYWVDATFEVWMFATILGPNSIKIRFQTNFPGAVGNYNIFRSTTSNFAVQTLVGSGLTGTIIDNGVVSNTQYYYKLNVLVGAVPTDITTWAIRTPA